MFYPIFGREPRLRRGSLPKIGFYLTGRTPMPL
jgi:hypothetical protein